MTPRTLRFATYADAPALRDLYASPSVNHQLGFEPPDAPAAVDDMLRAGGLRVVEQAGHIVAALRIRQFTHRMAHVAEISAVGVSPAHQGTGIGRWMIEQALDQLRATGIRRVQLTVALDNTQGAAFWRALNFEQEGTLHAYFRRAGETTDQDELAMARIL